MAINIFSGGANRNKTKSPNSASATDRAKQARNALSVPAETSASGGTAVGSSGTLAKVGKTIGKVAGIASKFLPGVGGIIAGGLNNLLNDPEWWQSVPGDALTLNEPLRLSPQDAVYNETMKKNDTFYANRASILEILPHNVVGNFLLDPLGTVGPGVSRETATSAGVLQVTDQMVTQYLMPEIRKVVNAVPLQAASDYANVLRSSAAIYAMWRTLKKFDYMCKHGQTYLANMNDAAFPLFQTGNAAWLQSTINRLEEYLRANVRLPHTLCEYLAWRFGRVYKSNSSAKSALVLYNALPIGAPTSMWDEAIEYWTTLPSSTKANQAALTDMYNAYYDHDYMVEVRDDTQFRFEMKEFMLRCNLQSLNTAGDSFDHSVKPLFALDSSLDNPTAFMATSVSSWGTLTPDDTTKNYECLFPVSSRVIIYIAGPQPLTWGTERPANYLIYNNGQPASATKDGRIYQAAGMLVQPDDADKMTYSGILGSKTWLMAAIDMGRSPGSALVMLVMLALTKSVDLYNCHLFAPLTYDNGDAPAGTEIPQVGYLDLSSLSIDAGQPTRTTLATEHIYAFANLVNIERKHSMSYKQAEKLVARDTAELVEKLDVATPATTPSASGQA